MTNNIVYTFELYAINKQCKDTSKHNPCIENTLTQETELREPPSIDLIEKRKRTISKSKPSIEGGLISINLNEKKKSIHQQ